MVDEYEFTEYNPRSIWVYTKYIGCYQEDLIGTVRLHDGLYDGLYDTIRDYKNNKMAFNFQTIGLPHVQ